MCILAWIIISILQPLYKYTCKLATKFTGNIKIITEMRTPALSKVSAHGEVYKTTPEMRTPPLSSLKGYN